MYVCKYLYCVPWTSSSSSMLAEMLAEKLRINKYKYIWFVYIDVLPCLYYNLCMNCNCVCTVITKITVTVALGGCPIGVKDVHS